MKLKTSTMCVYLQFFDMQPRDVLKKKVKVVLIYRNPKDVAVSYFHHVQRLQVFYHYTGDFNSFLIRWVDRHFYGGRVMDLMRE